MHPILVLLSHYRCMLYIHSILEKGLLKLVIKTPNCHDIHAHALDVFGYIKLSIYAVTF